MTRHRIITVFILLFSFALKADASGCADLVVSDALIREPPPVASVAAAYFRMTNEGSEPVTINALESACCEKILMHRSVKQDGQVRMSHMDRITLQPLQEIRFEPGAMHLMLISPSSVLRHGGHTPIVFSCENGGSIAVDFAVVNMN